VDAARGTTWLNIQLANNQGLLPGGLTQAQYDKNPRQAVNFKSFSHYQTRSIQLFNQYDLNGNWLLTTRLSHDEVSGDGMMGVSFDRQEWQNQFSPRLVGSIWNSKFTAGYDVQNSQYDFRNIALHERVHAVQNNLFAQAIIPLSNQTDFTIGARSAWQQNAAERTIGQADHSFNRVFVTEQGIAYHPSQVWQFYARRDGNFRFPKANEETWTPPNVVGLKPQTGTSYESGIIRTQGRQKTQINLFQLDLQNEIAFNPTETPAEPFGTYQNFKETRRRGVTLTESYQLTNQIQINSQINYVDARFMNQPVSGHMIPAVPNWHANVGLDYAFRENWHAKFFAVYTGSRYPSLDQENVGKKQSSYWLNDIALQYERMYYQVGFEVDNLFNAKYTAYTLYDSLAQSYLYYPGAGRSFLLTMKASLD
jgi:iron complex outermembrane receptor protein